MLGADGHRPVASPGRHHAGRHLDDVGAFEDTYTESFRCRSQPMHEQGRLQGGRGPQVARAVNAAHAGAVAGLLGVEVADVVVGEPELVLVGDVLPRALRLQRRPREQQPPAELVVAVDALGIGDPPDLVHGVDRSALEPQGCVTTVTVDERGEAERVLGVAPTAVATRRSEPDVLALDHDDPQRRIAARQVPGDVNVPQCSS